MHVQSGALTATITPTTKGNDDDSDDDGDDDDEGHPRSGHRWLTVRDARILPFVSIRIPFVLCE